MPGGGLGDDDRPAVRPVADTAPPTGTSASLASGLTPAGPVGADALPGGDAAAVSGPARAAAGLLAATPAATQGDQT